MEAVCIPQCAALAACHGAVCRLSAQAAFNTSSSANPTWRWKWQVGYRIAVPVLATNVSIKRKYLFFPKIFRIEHICIYYFSSNRNETVLLASAFGNQNRSGLTTATCFPSRKEKKDLGEQ